MISVAITGLHVEVSGAATGEVASCLSGKNLGGPGTLGVEETLAGDFSGLGGDDAAEVGVGRCETGRFVCQLGGASDVYGIERVGAEKVIVLVIIITTGGGGGSGSGCGAAGNSHKW